MCLACNYKHCSGSVVKHGEMTGRRCRGGADRRVLSTVLMMFVELETKRHCFNI